MGPTDSDLRDHLADKLDEYVQLLRSGLRLDPHRLACELSDIARTMRRLVWVTGMSPSEGGVTCAD